MDRNLILIASYPKSGNTWTRLVLQGLLKAEAAGRLNDLEIGFYAQGRRVAFDDFSPVPACDLLPEEVDRLLPDFNNAMAAEFDGPTMLKVHEMARKNAQDRWLFPADVVSAVLHLVRHPFDVAVSLANHMGISVEQSVDMMSSDFWYARGRSHFPNILLERLGPWSQHVASWVAPDLPYRCLTYRYEDLLHDDESCFRAMAALTGLEFTEEQLLHAVHSARFDKLSSQEQAEGFREKPRRSQAFFRSGKTMSWEGLLTERLRSRLVREHGEIMAKFGYREDGTTDLRVSTGGENAVSGMIHSL